MAENYLIEIWSVDSLFAVRHHSSSKGNRRRWWLIFAAFLLFSSQILQAQTIVFSEGFEDCLQFPEWITGGHGGGADAGVRTSQLPWIAVTESVRLCVCGRLGHES